MASQDGAQELVVVFDPNGSKIDLEMRYGQFKGLLAQKATLTSHAGNTVKAAYAQVGTGLTVHAVVFFLFKVNAEGYVDPAFNLPLDYMACNAGEGPDLGHGAIDMACRSQCPVPWHGINLWEPAGSGKAHPAMLVQKSVWRNRLGLKPLAVARRRSVTSLDAEERSVAQRSAAQAAQQIAAGQAGVRRTAAQGTTVQRDGAASVPAPAQVSRAARRSTPALTPGATEPTGPASLRALENKLTATFGEAGRLTSGQYDRQREQVGQVAAQFRTEMERQQQGYLEQIKSCREEIQKLKSALRHEQERNRRLQQLLRGDV